MVTIKVYGHEAPAGVIEELESLIKEAGIKCKVHIFGIPSFSMIEGERQPPTIKIINSTWNHLDEIANAIHILTKPPINYKVEKIINFQPKDTLLR
ncbi:MAG: hypothetical protein NUV64_01255 [Parcubacteria group bacterium]|nr:hypothetical protein [Parcubacteria group bacterium]MCR4342989.1 hypothetical protein [Patescibacteria group bacterium]